MGYRVKPFTMSVRNNSTQQFIDVGLLGSDVEIDINKLREEVEEQFKITDSIAGKNSRVLAHRGYITDNNPYCQDNSVFAFINAGIHGFKGIEVDPRKDIDGNLVCLHNETVDDISSSTGKISDLSYHNVFYKTKAGTPTDVHLTTVREMLLVAKIYNFFVLFDMGKNVVTCQEIVNECKNADFYNYGFFNVADANNLVSLPDYVIKVLGNDVFIHTEAELDSYISMFGSSKNLCVRVLTANTTDEQIELIKGKGFLILANFAPSNRIGTCTQSLISKIDFILGDYTPSAITGPFSIELQHVYSNIRNYVDALTSQCFTVVQAINGAESTMPLTTNFIVSIYKLSDKYVRLLAFPTIDTYTLYSLKKTNGVWDSSWTIIDKQETDSYTEIINTTESTYNIKLYGYAVGKTVTISALRESNHVSSSGWTTIGTIPVAYAPPTTLTSNYTDETGNRLIFRVDNQGAIKIWTIPAQQIACVITYAIA